MKNQKEIEGLLNDFSYDVDSDYGEMTLAEGIKRYTKHFQSLIQSEKDKWKAEMRSAIGEDDAQVRGKSMDDFKYPWAKTRNQLRQQIRDRLEKI